MYIIAMTRSRDSQRMADLEFVGNALGQYFLDNRTYPEFEGDGNVLVYSPLDGVVKSIRSEPDKGLEGEIWLGVKGNDWDFSIQHFNIDRNIKQGRKVKAGDILGYVAKRGIDVV